MTNAHCCGGGGNLQPEQMKKKKGFHNSDKYLQIPITYNQDKQTFIAQ